AEPSLKLCDRLFIDAAAASVGLYLLECLPDKLLRNGIRPRHEHRLLLLAQLTDSPDSLTRPLRSIIVTMTSGYYESLRYLTAHRYCWPRVVHLCRSLCIAIEGSRSST